MPRPPLTEEQVLSRVARYCERYDVAPGPGGLPPFPTGRRETRQHREWLTVYRALQRLRERQATADPAASDAPALEASPKAGTCPVCSAPLEPGLGVPFARRGRRGASVPLHPACAEMARVADTLGPAALDSLRSFLWPRRRPAPSA